MKRVHSAGLLVDVGIQYLAIVKRDGCVSDDVVLHLVWVKGLKIRVRGGIRSPRGLHRD